MAGLGRTIHGSALKRKEGRHGRRRQREAGHDNRVIRIVEAGPRGRRPASGHTRESATAAVGGEPLLGISAGRTRRISRPRLGRHRGICVADRAIDRLHCLAVGADVQPADGIADVGGGWIAALCGRSIRCHRLEHHPGLNHRQNAPCLVGSAGSQPLSRGQQLRRSGLRRRRRWG